MTKLTEQEKAVLAYYERDAQGKGGENPYAGLSIQQVRNIRVSLQRKGFLERSPGGRWRLRLVVETTEDEAA